MKIAYASSISYPSPYANRVQTLATAEALGKKLGENFVLLANRIQPNELYGHRSVNFGRHRGPVLAWKQLRYMREAGATDVYSREHSLLFFIMVWNSLFFHLKLRFFYEEHLLRGGFRFSFVMRRCAYVFAITAGLQKELLANYPSLSISVLPDGVDLSKFGHPESKESARRRLGLPAEGRVVLYAGRIDGWKGTDTLFQAAALLPKDVQTVIIGGETAQVEKVRMQYPQVRFLGYRPYEELADNQAAADVLVLPGDPQSATARLYTSPMKLFTYMTSGIPIAAADLPSYREVLSEQNAFFFEPRPDELASTVCTILEHPAEAVARAAQAKQDVLRYAWDARADAILARVHSNT